MTVHLLTQGMSWLAFDNRKPVVIVYSVTEHVMLFDDMKHIMILYLITQNIWYFIQHKDCNDITFASMKHVRTAFDNTKNLKTLHFIA